MPLFVDRPIGFLFWVCLLLGGCLQLILQRRAKRPFVRRAFAALLLLGLLVCEIMCQVTTGWDVFLPLLLYFYLLAMLLGVMLSMLARRLSGGRRRTS